MFEPLALPNRRTSGHFGQVHGSVLGVVFALTMELSCAAHVRTVQAREGVVPSVAPVQHSEAQALVAPPLLAPRLLVPVLWRYNTASPLTADPIVTPAGQAVLATAEGYLHAVAADGALVWNYTTQGAIVGQPGSDEHGRVYATSQPGRLYGIDPTGSAAWTYSVPVRLTSGPVWLKRGVVVVSGSDNHLWAISPRSGAAWRVPMQAPATAGPVATVAGELCVGVQNGGLLCGDGPTTFRRVWPALRSVDQLRAFDEQIVVRSEGLLQVGTLTHPEPAATWPGAQWAVPAAHGGFLLGVKEGVTWIDAHGEQRLCALPADDLTAAAVLDEQGTAYVPLQSGQIAVVHDAASASCRVRVWDAPLAGVLWFGRDLLVWNRQGQVAAVSPSSLAAAGH